MSFAAVTQHAGKTMFPMLLSCVRLLGPDTNEPWLGKEAIKDVKLTAPEFSIFSVDTYQWDYRLKSSGPAEVEQPVQVKEAATSLLSLIIQPHQQVPLVYKQTKSRLYAMGIK
jgi:hypothetical protein